MIYRPAYTAIIFLFLAQSLQIFPNQIDQKKMPNWDWDFKLNSTPSFMLFIQIDPALSAGIKLKAEGIDTEQGTFPITAAFFIKSKNDTLPIKAQLTIKKDSDPTLALSCAHPINQQTTIKGNVLFHQNDMPDFKIAANYTSNNHIQLLAQIATKHASFSHASLSSIYPINNEVKIIGNLIIYKSNEGNSDYIFQIISRNNSRLSKNSLLKILTNNSACFVIKKINDTFFAKKQQTLLEKLKLENSLLRIAVEKQEAIFAQKKLEILEEDNQTNQIIVSYNREINEKN